MYQPQAIKLGAWPDEDVLMCPRCGYDYLHHVGVKVFDRHEDEATLVRTTVFGAARRTEVVPSAGSGNPSTRRDGITVQFTCEGCSGDKEGDLELLIAQHKGQTELSWRFEALP